MSVTEKDVRYVANLANLQLSDEEVELYSKDLSRILDYMNLLNEVDTAGVEPLNHVIELGGRLRKDEAKEGRKHHQKQVHQTRKHGRPR